MADLQDQLAKRDAARADAAVRDLDALGAMVAQATQRKEGVPEAEAVTAKADAIEDALDATMPEAWKTPTDESDYDLIALTLDRMEAAVGAGEYRQAEQARLEAYAFFEFGPERRLQSFDPGPRHRRRGPDLVRRGRQAGPRRPDRRPRRAARGARDPARARREARRLGRDARRRGEQGDRRDQLRADRVPRGARGGADPRRHHRVVHRHAAAAAAPRADRRARRPARLRHHLGAGPDAAAVAPAVRGEARGGRGADRDRRAAADHELVLPPRVLERVDRPLPPPPARADGRRAPRVLLRAGPRPRAARADERLPRGLRDRALPAVARAQRGHGDRARGRGPGPGGDVAVAVFTFALQRKLPYKKMLIVTGVLLAFVLVVMVGQTARTMQGTGWMPITPAPVDVPYWAGLWFGVFPTWETLGRAGRRVRLRHRVLLPGPGGQGQAAAPAPRARGSPRRNASTPPSEAFPPGTGTGKEREDPFVRRWSGACERAVGAGVVLATLAAGAAQAATPELSVDPAAGGPPRGRGGDPGAGARVPGRPVLRQRLAHHGGDGRHRHAAAEAARLGGLPGQRHVGAAGDGVHVGRRLRALRVPLRRRDRAGAGRRRARRAPRRAARAQAHQPEEEREAGERLRRRALRADDAVPVGLRGRRSERERQRARQRRVRRRPADLPRHGAAAGRGLAALLHGAGRLQPVAA